MDKEPAFYIASSDTGPPINPRKCSIEEKLVIVGRDEIALLITIDPPIIPAPNWPPPTFTVSEAVVAVRHVGERLDSINRWPVIVNICRIVNDKFKGSGRISEEDIVLEYLGELYPTFEDADGHIEVHRRYYGGLGV